MCEQCLTWPVSFGQPLPGYTLMRARRDGNEWMKGEWALIECNDPTFRWKTTPTPNPAYGMDALEEAAFLERLEPGSEEYARVEMWFPPDAFVEGITTGTVVDSYKLVKAAIEKGYDIEEDGNFYSWFFDYLGEWIKNAEMVDEGDAFPKREEFAPVDLTIGKDPIEGEQ